MTLLRGLIAAIMVALIGGFVVWEETSPGRLHPVHARVAELQGEEGCATCHGTAHESMADACGKCHEDIMAQLFAGTGLHGSVAKADSCGRCHVEHRGAQHALTSDFSFTRAGFDTATGYDHSYGAGTQLVGRHLALECAECHEHAAQELLAPGEKRFLGIERRCVSCHEDDHEGRFGADCESCHGQDQAFELVSDFDHSGVPLIGKHQAAKCVDCHETSGATSVLELRTVPRHADRRCVDCHDNPHELGTSGPGSDHVFAISDDCAACHDSRAFAPAIVTAVDHEGLAFALLGPHADADCRQCHDARSPLAQSATALAMDVAPRACAACHESPHIEAFVQAVAASATSDGNVESETCSRCHEFGDETFRIPDAKMPRELHRGSGFALVAPHDRVECLTCHGGGQTLRIEEPRRIPDACGQCHDDPHAGQFDQGPTHGRCTTCHEATSFRPSKFDVSDHDATGLPLTGAHRAVRCIACHEKTTADVRQFAAISTRCASCHEDPHEGRFDGSDRPKSVAGEQGCARCHDTEGFRKDDWSGFDHRSFTGYELRGDHAKAACSKCHDRPAAEIGRRPFAGASRDCATCHTDPHAGQFRAGEKNDCSRCHSDAQEFEKHHFDHDQHSRFKPGEQHAKVECSACHKPVQVRAGPDIVRYRPLGRQCGDCHVTKPPRR